MTLSRTERGSSALPPTAAPFDLVSRVEGSPLETVPFHHIYITDAFSPEYYRRVLDALPAIRRYCEFPHRDAMRADGHSARRKFYLFPEHIRLLPAAQRAVWLPVSCALRARPLQEAFKRKFQVSLERRFRQSVDRLSFYPVPILLRDLPGYRIGIHGDSLSKAITAQFYLPRDESQADLGTVLHEGRSGPAAERAKRLAFRPASGYAFPVIYHESWHSVAPTGPRDGARDSLMLTYYVQDGFGWLVERLKRFWVFSTYGLRK